MIERMSKDVLYKSCQNCELFVWFDSPKNILFRFRILFRLVEMQNNNETRLCVILSNKCTQSPEKPI